MHTLGQEVFAGWIERSNLGRNLSIQADSSLNRHGSARILTPRIYHLTSEDAQRQAISGYLNRSGFTNVTFKRYIGPRRFLPGYAHVTVTLF